MGKLTSRELHLIQNLLQKPKKSQAQYNQSWQNLCDKLDIPIESWRQNNTILVDLKLRSLLREMAKIDSGFDLFMESLSGDRMAFSAKNSNEKLAPIKPEENKVLVRIINDDLGLPRYLNLDVSLRLSISSAIKLIKDRYITTIIIVENLDVFDTWQLQGLSIKNQPTLLVFNGSNKQYSNKGVRGLCEELLPINVQTMVFGDFDPAGIQIATKLPKISGIIVPANFQTLLAASNINHQADFFLQSNAQKYLVSHQWGSWQTTVDFILRHQISIKQQHILAHNFELKIIT